MALIFLLERDENFIEESITVNFNVGGTAIYGVDYSVNFTANGESTYTVNSGSFTFRSYVSNVFIQITPIGDTLVESDETVTLTLLASPGVHTLGVNDSATLTILNDDDNPVIIDYLVKLIKLLNSNQGSFNPGWLITNISRSVVDIQATVQEGSQDLVSLNLTTESFNSDLTYLGQEAVGSSVVDSGAFFYSRFNLQDLLTAATNANKRYLVLASFSLVGGASSASPDANINNVQGSTSLQKGNYSGDFNLNPVGVSNDLINPYVSNDPNTNPVRYPWIDNKWHTKIVCQYVPATGFGSGGTRNVYAFGFYMQIDTQNIENVQYIPFNIVDPIAPPPPIGYSYTTTYTKTTRPYSINPS